MKMPLPISHVTPATEIENRGWKVDRPSSILDPRSYFSARTQSFTRHCNDAIVDDVEQRREFVVGNAQWRHKNDNVSQRSNHNAALARLPNDFVPDSLLHRVIPTTNFVCNQFDAGHVAPLARVADMRERQKVPVQLLVQIGDSGLHLFQYIFSLKQLETCHRDGTTKWIARIGMAVEKRFEFSIFA